MHDEPNPITEIFTRPSTDAATVIADGYGIRLHVQHGHLVIDDGIGQHRRQRRYPRAQRTLKRVVVAGDTGLLTLDAIRWCADLGITITQIDREGRLLASAGSPGTDDARLRRAQALAPGSARGLDIVRWLLDLKIRGHASICEGQLDLPVAADNLRRLATSLDVADSIVECREVEANAANLYFGVWTGRVKARFPARDERVPDHWRTFSARRSPTVSGYSPRNAVTPVNALLNYSYALAETECRTALQLVGLDPGLGLVHADVKGRDSLALDLLEAIRPDVERYLLDLLNGRTFRYRDFHETRQGRCRLMPALTTTIGPDVLLTARRTLGPIAEELARHVGTGSPKKIRSRTPLTQRNVRDARTPGPRARADRANPSPVKTCRACGGTLPNQTRKLCSSCWSVERKDLVQVTVRTANKRLAELRGEGIDPTNTPAVRARRAKSLSDRKREQLAYDATNVSTEVWDETLPTRLADVPLSAMGTATGLSDSACSRIRSGKFVPHRRHWSALAMLAAEHA